MRISRRGRILLFGAFAVAALVLAGYQRLMQPKFRLASAAEVKAAFDPRLTEPVAQHPEARERFLRFVDIANRVDVGSVKRREEISLLEEGPIEEPPFDMSSSHRFFKVMDFLDSSLVEVEDYAQKDPARALAALIDSNRIRIANIKSHRHVASFGLAMRSHDELKATIKLLPALNRAQLDRLANAFDVDPDLSTVLQNTLRLFVEDHAGWIGRGMSWEPRSIEERMKGQSGTYDAIATTKLQNRTYVTMFEGVEKPLDQVDTSMDSELDRLRIAIPRETEYLDAPAGILRSLRLIFYRVRMNNHENTVGVQNGTPSIRAVLKPIADWRNERSMMRVAVAIRRFEVRNGKRPLALSELVLARMLSAVPNDAINGKPLIFDSTTGTIVSATGRVAPVGSGKQLGYGRLP